MPIFDIPMILFILWQEFIITHSFYKIQRYIHIYNYYIILWNVTLYILYVMLLS